VRATEWIAVAYFLYLIGTASTRSADGAARGQVIVRSMALIALAGLSPLLPPGAHAVRDVLPLVYLLAGYWLPARLVEKAPGNHTLRAGTSQTQPSRSGSPSFERWLVESDERIERLARVERWTERAPRVLLEALELAYFLSYVLVPLGFGAVILGGRADAVDRYWSVALLAHLSAFGTLPWLDAQPPWSRGPSALDARRVAMRRVNLLVVREGSNRRNTFPSGHAAGAVAIAAFMLATVPAAGPAFVLLAAGICVGAYTGRYHYAADILAGGVTGWLSWRLVWWAGV
jgi:membrane-associated phospholipid phosphatase